MSQDWTKVLEDDIKRAYEEGVSMEQAERLAAKFLSAQLSIAADLHTMDLDARMRKTSLKAIRGAVYLDAATKGDKKPSDVMLGALVDTNDIVGKEQDSYDRAEADRDYRQNLYNICKEAHIYFRGVAKGAFGG